MIDLTLHNADLDGAPFFYEGDSIGVLLIHGLTATTTEVRFLADSLHRYGWTISAPLLPGHGTNLFDLERYRWQDWVEAVASAYQSLAVRCGQVFVGGESMGGLLACYLARTHPEIAGLLLYAPAFRARSLWLTPFVHLFYRFKSKKNLNDQLLWKGYRYHSTRAAFQLFLLQRVMESRLKLIHQPLSMFLGKRDTAISLSAAEMVFDQIPSINKIFHIYGESGHCMILDREKEIITKDSIRFIQDILKEKTE